MLCHEIFVHIKKFQHDCQEFLALLLDGLHEQLNTATSKDIACQVETEELPEKRNVSVSVIQSNLYIRFG